QVVVFELAVGLEDTMITACYNTATALNPSATAKDAIEYIWTPTDNLDLSDPSNPIFTGTEDAAYMVEARDTSGACMASTTIEVMVLPKLGVEGQNDTTICEVGNVELSATAPDGFTIEWYDDPELTNLVNTGNTYDLFADQAQQSLFVSISDDQCVDVDTIVVTVFELKAGVMDTVVVCPGEFAALNPDGCIDYEYTWEPTDGLALGVPSQPIVNVFEDMTYYVTVVDPMGECRLEDSVFVDVQPIADIDVTLDTTICEEGEFTLTATTDLPATIRWFTDSLLFNIVGVGETVTLRADSASQTFYVSAVTEERCIEVEEVNVDVFRLKAGLLFDTLVICPNADVQINPNGEPTYLYEWTTSKDLDLTDNHNPVVNLESEEQITIIVNVTTPDSLCSLEKEITIIAREEPNLSLSADTTLCMEDDIQLFATTNDISIVEWYNDPQLEDLFSTGSTIDVTADFAERTFYVQAVDSFMCTNVDSIVVEVFENQFEFKDTFQVLCADVATFVDLLVIDKSSNANFSYQWTPATGLDDPTSATPTATISQTQIYTLLIEDNDSDCSFEQVITLEVAPPINLVVPKDTILCEPTVLSLAATFDVPVNIEWFEGDINSNPIAMEPVLQIRATENFEGGTYIAVVQDTFGCTAMDTVVVEFMPFMVEALQDTVNACLGDVAFLNETGDASLSYSWSPADSLDDATSFNPSITARESMLFNVVISDSEGKCMVDDSVFLNVIQPYIVPLPGDTIFACGPEEIQLDAGDVPVGIEIIWSQSPDFNPIFSTGNELLVAAGEPTTYYVMSTNAANCMFIDSIFIEDKGIDALISQGDSIVLCEAQDTLILSVLNNRAEQTLMYEWMPFNAITTDPFAAEVVVDLNASQNFSVEVMNEFGCVENLETIVTIIDLANDVTVEPMETTIDCGESVQIVTTAENCENCTYSWSPAIGLSDPNIANPIASPEEPTTYTLKVRNGECEQEFTVTINVDCTCDLDVFVPNAFTPNITPGTNDVLFVRGQDIDELLFIIYNRAGQEIFRTTNINIGWDGSVNGEPLPSGTVFGYFVRATCFGNPNQTIELSGNVTIF
ncbi:MAG: gliding motility-associated C-terminal domain-containing protein, partial [Bacteroidota bacterium]